METIVIGEIERAMKRKADYGTYYGFVLKDTEAFASKRRRFGHAEHTTIGYGTQWNASNNTIWIGDLRRHRTSDELWLDIVGSIGDKAYGTFDRVKPGVIIRFHMEHGHDWVEFGTEKFLSRLLSKLTD